MTYLLLQVHQCVTGVEGLIIIWTVHPNNKSALMLELIY